MSVFLWQSTLLGRVQDPLKATVLQFENTKGLERIRKSKKNRQCSGLKKK